MSPEVRTRKKQSFRGKIFVRTNFSTSFYVRFPGSLRVLFLPETELVVLRATAPMAQRSIGSCNSYLSSDVQFRLFCSIFRRKKNETFSFRENFHFLSVLRSKIYFLRKLHRFLTVGGDFFVNVEYLEKKKDFRERKREKKEFLLLSAKIRANSLDELISDRLHDAKYRRRFVFRGFDG